MLAPWRKLLTALFLCLLLAGAVPRVRSDVTAEQIEAQRSLDAGHDPDADDTDTRPAPATGAATPAATTASTQPAAPANPHPSFPGMTITPAAALPSVFCCGDSTCKNSGLGADGVQMLEGWGTPIGTNDTGWSELFDPTKVTVKNVGHGGTSATTYYTGDWTNTVLGEIQPGDYVIIVFGINTDPHAGTADTLFSDGLHTYGWYMKQMALDTLAKGAHPYFLTLTIRDTWTNPNATFDDTGNILTQQAGYTPDQDRLSRTDSHVAETKLIAAEINVPVFDLNAYEADLYETMGRVAVVPLYSDHNHTYIPGAQLVSKMVLAGVRGFNNSPFLPLLSTAGKAITTCDPKYITDNLAVPQRPTSITPLRP